MEHVGHKFGYNMKDSTGALAPIVRVSREENNQPPEVQRMEFARLRDYTIESPVDGTDMPKRGFGKGYESFPEDISTDIDVEKLVHHLKKCGVEVSNSSLWSHSCCRRWICSILHLANIHLHGCRALHL